MPAQVRCAGTYQGSTERTRSRWRTRVAYFSICYATTNYVFALNANSGGIPLELPARNLLWYLLAVANGVVYVSSDDNNVYALNASTGVLLWKYATGNSVYGASTAVADGVVYVGSEDDNLYALNAEHRSSVVESSRRAV